MLSPSAAPRWMMKTKSRSVGTVAITIRGATSSAPAPAVVRLRKRRRATTTGMLSPQEVRRDEQQGERHGRTFAAGDLVGRGGGEGGGQQLRRERARIDACRRLRCE